MAASFVNRGALNRDLALDNFGEIYFVYAKIEPYLQGYRDAVGMQQFLQQAQQLVDSSPEARERLKNMQKLQASIRQPVAGATAGR